MEGNWIPNQFALDFACGGGRLPWIWNLRRGTVRIYSTAGELKSKAVRTLVNWWNACAAGGQIPARADFDPLEFRHARPHLLIAEPEDDQFRIRYRLVGTKIVEAVGWDFTGTYLDDLLTADDAAPWISAYRHARDNRTAVYGLADTPIPRRLLRV